MDYSNAEAAMKSMIQSTLVIILLSGVLLASEDLSFKALDGKENGTAEILSKRKAEVAEKNGGKLGSHDWWPWALTNIDYDNDGDQDLMVGIHGPRNGVVMRNNLRETGKLTFTDVTKELGVDGEVPAADWNAMIWDFDGDGFLDIAGMFDDTSTPSLLNEGGKKFTKAAFNFHPVSKQILITDLNGDGHPDAHYGRQKHIIFIYDPAAKNFKREIKPGEIPSGIDDAVGKEIELIHADKKGARFFSAYYETAFDLNSDGHKDVVIAGFSGYAGPALGRYLAGDGKGNFSLKNKEWGLPDEGTPILFKDLNGDGATDILINAGKDGGLYVNDGKGNFKLKAGALTDFVKVRSSYQQRPYQADFNNDGKLDLILSNRRGRMAQVYENKGADEFKLVQSLSGWDADPLVIVDMNDDGLVDITIGGPGETITVFENQTKDAGQWAKIYPRMEKPNPYAIDAVVEVFTVGDLGKKDVAPIFAEKAHPDATPVHVGLAQATTFDLRVTFPGKEPRIVELKNVAAGKRLKVSPDGKSEELK
jgi:hypothetical protein